jgi:hypothetical protein
MEGSFAYASSLATSGTVASAASLASAWRSLRTICSGECRLPIKSTPYAHPGLLDPHSNWTSFRGAGHKKVAKGTSSRKTKKPGGRKKSGAGIEKSAERLLK